MSPQRMAALWHYGDVALGALVLGFAIGGLIGHYRLRKPYVHWHQSQPWQPGQLSSTAAR